MGASNLIFECRVKISGISFPPKKSALCLGIYDEPSRILRQNLSKMGVLIFFKKLPEGFEILLFLGGEEEKGGGEGGSFFCEMAQFCK